VCRYVHPCEEGTWKEEVKAIRGKRARNKTAATAPGRAEKNANLKKPSKWLGWEGSSLGGLVRTRPRSWWRGDLKPKEGSHRRKMPEKVGFGIVL